jgi:hypothetical protein
MSCGANRNSKPAKPAAIESVRVNTVRIKGPAMLRRLQLSGTRKPAALFIILFLKMRSIISAEKIEAKEARSKSGQVAKS